MQHQRFEFENFPTVFALMKRQNIPARLLKPLQTKMFAVAVRYPNLFCAQQRMFEDIKKIRVSSSQIQFERKLGIRFVRWMFDCQFSLSRHGLLHLDTATTREICSQKHNLEECFLHLESDAIPRRYLGERFAGR